jgi:DNA-binding PadR family transcriptional regulator
MHWRAQTMDWGGGAATNGKTAATMTELLDPATSANDGAKPAPKAVVTEAGYLILLSLADGESHGYRIMQVINDVFRTDLRIGPGTLYRTLQRLTADGLIVEVEGDAGDGDPERRRAFRITARGEHAAREETSRLEALVRLARVQLVRGRS